ncbi:uncharacterized protein BJ212DRAFT_1297010 [Suillus subaureus]|uniref:MIF4G domain-containing protein n=1 Tax=Suillus subaureus TaxID=48587 RepID=A0A9P7JGV4_9AGAM|nr:uncharacterized protein BJ212DRAFT_1297010 [Suillus subaureus]KAG1821664.1 hypothetical protein BJ212DRAFT_1297010 [Suillus subaureus]
MEEGHVEVGGNGNSVDDDDHEMTETKQGEPSDAQPKAAGRYIPPGLRKQANGDTNETEEQLKLTRQLKECVNKALQPPKTSTLTSIVIDGISSHSTLLDSYVVLRTAFISSLHKLICTAFAAYFVQNVVSSYEHPASVEEKSANSMEVSEDLGKEYSNLIVLLSELYNFQFRVELLLKFFQHVNRVLGSGQQLRQDDPMALKDIVTLAQTGQADTMSSRTRFMIETLNNLKNNKTKKTAATQHQGGDAVERMKKFLSGLGKKKHVLAHEPLRVSLEDLHSAESKGKWWLIGAAWGGDPLADQPREVPQHSGEPETDDVSTAALLKLYLDACERLAQLGLTEVQQREIIRDFASPSLAEPVSQEKFYNPYHTLVCQNLSQR